MSTYDRLRLIRAHLEATSRGRSPDGELVGVGARELQDIPDDRLDDCIREARAHHAEQTDRGKRWGKITPDDVLMAWTRQKAPEAARDRPPFHPHCKLGCHYGRIDLNGPDGYDFTTRCSCSSGDWWLSRPRWAAMTGAEELLRHAGYVVARPKPKPLPDGHLEWLQARAGEVGVSQALNEYRTEMKNREREAESR